MTLKNIMQQLDDPTRRQFIASLAGAYLGVKMLPQAMAAPMPQLPKNPINVIYLYMSGGMSHLETLDPKSDQKIAGPTNAIGTDLQGVQLSEHMVGLANHLDKLAIIRSLSSKQGAHEQAYYLMHTSYASRGTIIHPSMGTWMMQLQGKSNPKLPGNVIVGSGYQSSGYMPPKLGPLIIGDPNKGLQNSKLPKNVTPAQFERRLKLADRLNLAFNNRYRQSQVKAYNDMYNDAIGLMKSKDIEVFNLKREPGLLRERYGQNPFGQGCLLARRLVEQGVRFVEVSLNGWDMHDDLFRRASELAPTLDQALSSLLTDLADRNMLDSTLVVLATEFGRTPTINANKGRDHYPRAFSCLLAGANVQRGQVIGQTNAQGSHVESEPFSVADFNATVAAAAGLPLDKIVYSPTKRPFTVANKGKPIAAALTI